MNYLGSILLLTLFYLGITSNLEVANIIAGFVIASCITLLLRLKTPSFRWKEFHLVLFALGKYILILAYDLFKSGFQVAGIVLSRSAPIHQGIAALPVKAESEVGTALSAHAISLTPGELVLEMDDEVILYTHCLDATRATTYVQDAQEMREELLDKIFP